jgi:hypothetical protein
MLNALRNWNMYISDDVKTASQELPMNQWCANAGEWDYRGMFEESPMQLLRDGKRCCIIQPPFLPHAAI